MTVEVKALLENSLSLSMSHHQGNAFDPVMSKGCDIVIVLANVTVSDHFCVCFDACLAVKKEDRKIMVHKLYRQIYRYSSTM